MEKNRDYNFKVYKDEFNDWVCEYNDIPGLIGVGSTVEEAITEAKVFLDLHLDTLDQENAEYPSKSSLNNHSGRITVRVSKSTHRRVAQFAENENISINQFITDAIHEYLGFTKTNTKVIQALESLKDFALFEAKSKQSFTHEINELFDKKQTKAYYRQGLNYGK